MNDRFLFTRDLFLSFIVIACCLLLQPSVFASGKINKNHLLSNPSTSVVLQLRWFHQFQFAGYYAAKEKGFYADEGLDVTIREGNSNISTVEEVVQDRAQYGVTNSEILLDRLTGTPLVVIASIFQHSPLVLVTRKVSEITNPQNLINRKVKMSRDPREIEIQAMFLTEGVSLDQLKIVDTENSPADYLDPEFDALSAYLTNEPFFLKKANIPFTVISPSSYGIDFYGDCLFTSEHEVELHSSRIDAFKRASLKGWQYALSHQSELIQIIREKYSSRKSTEHLVFEADAVSELIVPELIEIGHINPGRWNSIAKVFARLNLVPKDYSLDGFIYQPPKTTEPIWLKWAARVLFAILLFVATIAITLFVFNRRLQREIRIRKLSESAFRESEARFKLLINNAEILVSINDRNGVYLLMNNKVAAYFGGLPNDFINRSIYDLFPKDTAEIYVERIRLVMDSDESRVYEDIMQFQSESRWMITSIQPLKNVSGETYAVQSISHDITERKQAENDVKESEERYRAISEITSDFAYAYNLTDEGRQGFIWVTDAIVDITGYSVGEIAEFTHNWNSLVHPDDLEIMDRQLEALKSGKSSIIEYRIIKKDGTLSWLRDHSKLKISNETTRVYGAIRDITESKQTKEALQQTYYQLESRVEERTRKLNEMNRKLREEIRYREEIEEKLTYAKRQAEQANSAKTEFLANVSHELRTPMHHILNYSKYGITKFDKTTPEKLLHYFTQIRKTGDRLMLLLNDLLDLSKLETGKVTYSMNETNIYHLIQERVSELGSLLEKKNLMVNLEVPSMNTNLVCDAYKIGQVIQNLLSNAIKFTPEGKSISIYFEPSILSIKNEQNHIEAVSALSVFFGDQGIGIPDRELETVFDKFVQSSKTRTGAGGTGLGLSICKEIIEAHNGVIYADNNEDGGATFTFTLPYEQVFENSEQVQSVYS